LAYRQIQGAINDMVITKYFSSDTLEYV